MKGVCRHCKKLKDVYVDCKHKKSDGSFRVYYSCTECNTSRARNYRQKNKKRICQIANKYYYRNKQKASIWAKVRNEHVTGRLKKPTKCEVCQSKSQLDAHHPDYNQPIKVQYLCRKCHKKAHQNANMV